MRTIKHLSFLFLTIFLPSVMSASNVAVCNSIVDEEIKTFCVSVFSSKKELTDNRASFMSMFSEDPEYASLTYRFFKIKYCDINFLSKMKDQEVLEAIKHSPQIKMLYALNELEQNMAIESFFYNYDFMNCGVGDEIIVSTFYIKSAISDNTASLYHRNGQILKNLEEKNKNNLFH